MPSALDRCFWLEGILIALRVTWLDGLNIFGDAIGQKKIYIFDSCQVLSQHESEILNDLDERLSFLLACIRLKLSGDVKYLWKCLWSVLLRNNACFQVWLRSLKALINRTLSTEMGEGVGKQDQGGIPKGFTLMFHWIPEFAPVIEMSTKYKQRLRS